MTPSQLQSAVVASALADAAVNFGRFNALLEVCLRCDYRT